MIPSFLVWWTLSVASAPFIRDAKPRLSSYFCVGATDRLLPFSEKSKQVAIGVYDSLGGENYIQAMWLVPITEMRLRLRYDKTQINKLYAATAAYADSPNGYNAISDVLYRRPYCSLSSGQKQVVEFTTLPSPTLFQLNPALEEQGKAAQARLHQVD